MAHKMFMCLVVCIFTYQPTPVHPQGLNDAMQNFATFNSPHDFPSDAGGFPSDAGGFPSDSGFPSDPGFPADPPTDPGVPAKPKTSVDPKKPTVDQTQDVIGTGHGKGDSGMPQDLGMTSNQVKKTDTGMPVEGLPKDMGPADGFPGEPGLPADGFTGDLGFPATDPGMPIGQGKPADTHPVSDPFGFPDDTGFPSETGPPSLDTGSSELPWDFFPPLENVPPPKEPIRLDNAFLPNIPIGKRFTNLETGETKEFTPFDKSNTVNDKGTPTLRSSHLDSSGKQKGVKPVIPPVDISPEIPPFEPKVPFVDSVPFVDPVPVIDPVKPEIKPDVKLIDPIVKPIDTGKLLAAGVDKQPIDPWKTPHIDQATKDRILAEMMNPNRGGGIFVPPKTHFVPEPASHIDSIIGGSNIHIDPSPVKPIFIAPKPQIQPRPKSNDAWKLNQISGGLSGYKGRTRKDRPRVAAVARFEPIRIKTSAVEQDLKEQILKDFGGKGKKGMAKALRKIQQDKYRKQRQNRNRNKKNRNRNKKRIDKPRNRNNIDKPRNRNNFGKPKMLRFMIPPLNGGRRGGQRRGGGGNRRYKRQAGRFGISTL